jgi:phosphopentomutase
LKRAIIIFLDGVGIGKSDYQNNPFFKFQFKSFLTIWNSIPSIEKPILSSGHFFLKGIDPLFDIPGLPQSGTGQTSIFCGVKAPQLIKQHFGPFPHSSLHPIIREKNIFKYFLDKKYSVNFINAYPKVFFDYIKSGKTRFSVTTLCCLMNNQRLNKAIDIWKHKAITAEITNERWRKKLNYKLPIISPKTAARRLLKVSSENKLLVYEYFLTDHLGHGRYEGNLEQTLNELDEFLLTLFTEFESKSTLLVVCSDHGNFEDLSVKTHTLNQSLFISAGSNSEQVFESVFDLSDLKCNIIKSII